MKNLILLFFSLLIGFSSLSAANTVVICKHDMKLRVIDDSGKIIFTTGIACGVNKGNKTRRGDHKTPEGSFTINAISPSSTWDHDFRDGKGKIKGAYGPWFMRLKVPRFTHIGIHGTHDPSSIGRRASEGCIRVENSQLERLRKLVRIGTPVIILPETESFNSKKKYK